MYLVDTNIWLEILLEQEEFESAYEFLSSTDSSHLYLTDFSIYSIGIILSRLKKSDLFNNFINDVLIEANVNITHLLPEDLVKIREIIDRFNLDFDDAYHYVTAEKFDLKIVSFDTDFDKTEKGRLIPKEIIKRSKMVPG